MPLDWKFHNSIFDHDNEYPLAPASPWGGHRNFAYDLVSYLKPKSILELGTHYGVSLFTFAQASKDLSINCDLFAIDTWKGDEQAGFYGSEVLDHVNKIKNSYFPGQKINLIQSFFSDGIKNIPDNSCDIIHIDGLHTEKAVREDFAISAVKLKKDGIILFHDVDPSCGYGSAIVFEELLSKYPGFRFTHSWGLGVLSLNKNSSIEYIIALHKNGYFGKYPLEYRSYLAEKSYDDAKVKIADLDSAFEKAEKLIVERDEYIKNLEEKELHNPLKNYINDLQSAFRNTEKLVEERDKYILELKDAFSNTEKLVRERDNYILELEALCLKLKNKSPNT